MPVRIRARATSDMTQGLGAPATGPGDVQRLPPARLREALDIPPGGLTTQEDKEWGT
ncbi:hypothetical protein ACH4Q6_11920 [Streptomyces lydicus]|uniref:hypothetical protein n=1 Tax=Streptomyces lydicus TaxID=47763 RepID=UPI0037B2C0AE